MSLLTEGTKNFSASNISLQSSLDNIYKWLKTKKLDFNLTKCKILTTKKKTIKAYYLKINNTKIPTIDVFKG